MINLNEMIKLEALDGNFLTKEQIVMGQANMNKGFEAYLERYSDYSYLVLVKDGVRNGIKRLNKTGHDVYVQGA